MVELREKKKRADGVAWNQSELARFVGISRQAYRQLEAGSTKDPPLHLLKALSDCHGVPIEEFHRFIAEEKLASKLASRRGAERRVSGSGSDLTRHGIEVNSRAEMEGPAVEVTAHARLLEELADARKTIREMRAAASRIGAEIAEQIATAEGFEARHPESGRGDGGRRAG